MRRGTTPPFTISTDIDLTNYTVRVCVKQPQTELVLTPTSVTSGAVTFALTQEQTLSLDAGETARVQIRAARGNVSYAGDILPVEVQGLLTGGELI
jgi:hypothetical protein